MPLEISSNRVTIVLESGEIYMKVKVILEPSEEGGYTALVPALPGCISEGDTKEEAIKNIKEAIELYLEPVDDDFFSHKKINIKSYFKASPTYDRRIFEINMTMMILNIAKQGVFSCS